MNSDLFWDFIPGKILNAFERFNIHCNFATPKLQWFHIKKRILKQMKDNDLVRQLGFVELTAIGECLIIGASINVVPFKIQRNVKPLGVTDKFLGM